MRGAVKCMLEVLEDTEGGINSKFSRLKIKVDLLA